MYNRRFVGFLVAVSILLLSSCSVVTKSHLGENVVADERVELESGQGKIWSTDDLAIHYNVVVDQDAFTLSGFVEISTSVTNTFPQADYLTLYVYLLDSASIATSRKSLRLNISKYNSFPDKIKFNATFQRENQTAAIAFGYFGNFISMEKERQGRRFGFEKMEWEIYHVPFQ